MLTCFLVSLDNPPNEFQVISMNFSYVWRVNVKWKWNSSKSTETRSEDYQEIQEDTVRILLHFIRNKGKN